MNSELLKELSNADSVASVEDEVKPTSSIWAQNMIFKGFGEVPFLWKIILPKRSLKTSSLYFANSR